MKVTLSELIIFIIIFSMIITSIKSTMLNRSFYNVVDSIIGSVSIIVSFFIMFFFYNYFYEKISMFLMNFYGGEKFLALLKILFLIIVFLIIKWIIYSILSILNRIFTLGNSSGRFGGEKIVLLISSTFLGVIRGALVVICILMGVITYNGLIGNNFKINMFSNLKVYNKLSSVIDDKTVYKIKSGLVEDASLKTIVYYNGVTLDEGVKSNKAIDDKAKEITKNLNTDKEKAKAIYKWVGSNINYDFEKAEKIMDTNIKNSGAIEAFDERKGICFDYACLYVAMCRAVGLDVRLIIGEAYNGQEYISHSWNQVYLKNEKRWINVDPTFYSAGNYFDNKDFYKDHKEKNIAGQW